MGLVALESLTKQKVENLFSLPRGAQLEIRIRGEVGLRTPLSSMERTAAICQATVILSHCLVLPDFKTASVTNSVASASLKVGAAG